MGKYYDNWEQNWNTLLVFFVNRSRQHVRHPFCFWYSYSNLVHFKQSQLGGLMTGDRKTDEVWRYDNQQWDKYDNMLRPRSNHQSALINNNIVHIGGRLDGLNHFRFLPNFRKQLIQYLPLHEY